MPEEELPPIDFKLEEEFYTFYAYPGLMHSPGHDGGGKEGLSMWYSRLHLPDRLLQHSDAIRHEVIGAMRGLGKMLLEDGDPTFIDNATAAVIEAAIIRGHLHR